jgi:hypothetical protein
VRAFAFWKAIATDRSNFLEGLIQTLTDHGIDYCVIGGRGVDAYAEPLVNLDLNLVVAVEQLTGLKVCSASVSESNSFRIA